MQIPKKIHYCWFGENEKPAIVKKCIESWIKYMPDYEIIEWNEENYNCHKTKYIDEAYKCKKWAFVSDYARFDIIEQHGGIYFDTDVELLKPIPSNILENVAFTGMEPLGNVNPGLVFAAIPHFKFTKEILKVYSKEKFIENGKPICKTVNAYTTEILKPKGFICENKFQIIDNLAIYPSEIFCGFDLDIHEISITENTVSVHHYAGTWINNNIKSEVKKIFKKLLGKKIYKKILLIIRKYRRKYK